MNRRPTILQRSIRAGMREQARIKRENAATVPRMGGTSAVRLDALHADALERLKAQIGTATLQHSVQIAMGFCGQEVRLHQLVVRRNIEARSILKNLSDEAFRIRAGVTNGRARR